MRYPKLGPGSFFHRKWNSQWEGKEEHFALYCTALLIISKMASRSLLNWLRVRSFVCISGWILASSNISSALKEEVVLVYFLLLTLLLFSSIFFQRRTSQFPIPQRILWSRRADFTLLLTFVILSANASSLISSLKGSGPRLGRKKRMTNPSKYIV